MNAKEAGEKISLAIEAQVQKIGEAAIDHLTSELIDSIEHFFDEPVTLQPVEEEEDFSELLREAQELRV